MALSTAVRRNPATRQSVPDPGSDASIASATRLIRRYHLTRGVIALAILVVTGVLVLVRSWWEGLAIVAMAAGIIVDARMRHEGRLSQSPWVPLIVDSTAVGIASVFGQLPAEAVIPPFSYMVVCAFALLSIRSAAWFLPYPIAWLAVYLIAVETTAWSGVDLWIIRATALLTYLPGMVALLVAAAGVMRSAEQLDVHLAASQRQLQAAVTGAPLILFEYDADGIFVLSEGAGLAKLGLQPGQVVGMSALEVYADTPQILAGVKRSLTGESFLDVVQIGDVFFQVSYSAQLDDRGRLDRVTGVAADVSDRVAAEDALANLVRSKDEFVATIAHELRTPLTAVVGLAEELRSSYQIFDPAETEEFVGMIADQSYEVAAIVEDLLVVARSDIGKVTVVSKEVDLRQAVEGVLAETNHLRTASTRSVAVEGEPIVAFADPQRVRQILRNLVTNAYRYGGENVWIELAADSARARIVVADSGSGIPERDWETIFEPFARAHDALGQPGSIGLGLSVGRKLAEAMGGALVYRNGRGRSEFELSLPPGR